MDFELYMRVPRTRNRDNKGRFLAGHSPYNKGKKGTGGNKQTCYQAGHTPHNTKHDGAISIRKDKRGVPYYFIRLGKNNWVHLHRHVWETANGPLQKGEVVRFVNGNTLDCSIGNLSVTTKSGHLQLNRNYAKAGATMREHWRRERVRELCGLPPITGLGNRLKERRAS